MSLSATLALTRPLIVFDYETTSKNPETARIVQISMRVHRPDGSLKVYKTLVNPGVPIPKESSDIHGITDEIIRTGCARCKAPADVHPNGDCAEWKPVPAFRDLAQDMFRGFTNADFSGYNIRYDLRVSAAEFRRSNMEFDYAGAFILDALRLWQILEPRTLSDAVEHFLGRKLAGAHDANTDTEATEDVLLAQLTRHTNCTKIPRTMQEIHELCYPRDPNGIDSEGKFIFIQGVPCVNFGKKCKGEPMKANVGYLNWMLGQDFSPEVKRICQDAVNGKFPVQAEAPKPVASGDDSM